MSAQRELNPHFRHGKAVRNRYIMGADEGEWTGGKGQVTRIGIQSLSLNAQPSSLNLGLFLVEMSKSTQRHASSQQRTERPGGFWLIADR